MSTMAVLIILACFWAACWAYPTGAPDSVCASMTPAHDTTDTASLGSSYAITTSKNQYSPGEKVAVTISGNSGAMFRGFLVQVRQGATAVGTVVITGGQITCNQAAATHTSNTDKSTISMNWTAPASSAGDVQVWATVVQTQPVWTTIKGPIITAVVLAPLTTTASVKVDVSATTTPANTVATTVTNTTATTAMTVIVATTVTNTVATTATTTATTTANMPESSQQSSVFDTKTTPKSSSASHAAVLLPLIAIHLALGMCTKA